MRSTPATSPRQRGFRNGAVHKDRAVSVWVVATRCSDYSLAMFWGDEYLGRRADRRRWKAVVTGVALATAPGFAATSWGQAPPNVVVTEFTGSNLPGINFVWAAVLIGIAVIILVAQQITHRLALRREADARGDLSRRLIEARERLATRPVALIEGSGAGGAVELEPRAAELLSLNRPQTTLEEVRALLQNDGPNAEETWAAPLSGKGAAAAGVPHVHTV